MKLDDRRARALGAQHPIRRALRRIDDVRARVRAPRAQAALERAHPGQRRAWAQRAARAPEILARLDGDDAPRSEPWGAYEREVAKLVRHGVPWDFLRHPTIQETMLVRGTGVLERELAVVRAARDEPGLRRLLSEDPAGCPPPARGSTWTSPTAVHHLHHLERLRRATGSDPFATRTVVEWGGGYGALARLLRRGSSRPPSHLIVDLPPVLALQWIWIGTVCGDDAVVVLEPGEPPPPDKVALATSEQVALPSSPDLLVSTWGLSETPALALAQIEATLHGARHVLLAGQRPDAMFPDAAWPLDAARRAGAALEPVGVLPGSTYAFR